MHNVGGCLWLSGIGGLMEVGGLAIVVVQLTRVQRRDLGTPAWIGKVRAIWRRVTGRSGRVVYLQGLDAAASSDATLRLSVGRAAADETLDARVKALEANLAELDRKTDERFGDMEQRLSTAHERVDALRADMEKIQREADEARREELRESVTLQWWGTGLFVLGVVASFLGNAVSC
jgi:hypothetical protein